MTTHTLRPLTPTLYSRIREELRERILSGAWQPHDRVPSESALMAQYGVSRITVRQALGDLASARMIFKVPGKGAFVAETKPFQELGHLQGFAEAMGAMGHETFNRVLRSETVAADDVVAERLRLEPGTPVTHVQRVHYLGREPVSVDHTWLPQPLGDRVVREDLASRDIFLIIENEGATPLGHADLSLGALLADAEIGGHLGIRTGAPVLHIERLTHDRDGRPIDFEHLYCRSDSFQYRMRLDRR